MNSLAVAYDIPTSPMTRLAGDAADRLPPAARDKLLRIRQAAEDARAVMEPLSDQIQELRQTVQGHSARLRALEVQGVRSDHTATLDAAAKLARAKATLERAQSLHEERSALWRPRRALATRLDEFISKLPGTVTAVESQTVTLKRGEVSTTAVARLRADVERLKNEIVTVEEAPLPAEAAKEMWRVRMERARERGAPKHLLNREHGIALPVPTTNVICRDADGKALSFAEVADVEALFAYVFGDEWLAQIERDIDAANDSGGLTDEARHERLGELRAELLHVERAEEALVEQSGIERRPDCDPRAILGLAA